MSIIVIAKPIQCKVCRRDTMQLVNGEPLCLEHKDAAFYRWLFQQGKIGGIEDGSDRDSCRRPTGGMW